MTPPPDDPPSADASKISRKRNSRVPKGLESGGGVTIHVGVKHQVTLPKEIIQQAHLSPGDPLEVIYEEDTIILRPQVHIPRDQAYFWTKEWQAMEREADEAIRLGHVYGPFRSVKEMKRHFKKIAKK